MRQLFLIQELKSGDDFHFILETWAVKLRFLFICENMLENIASALTECTAKHENKASYNLDYVVSDLIHVFGDD